MKRCLFSAVTVIFLLTACDNSLSTNSETEQNQSSLSQSHSDSASTDETSSDETESASESISISYEGFGKAVYEISSSTAQVSISALESGKTIYLANTNPTSSAISATGTRYVSSATGISLSSGDGETASSESSASSGSKPSGRPWPHHCLSLALNTSLPQVSESSARSVSFISQVTPVAYSQSDVGSASRSIYVDQDENISSFKKETAYLRAVGEFCYIWVMQDNWTESSASGEKINAEIAQSIAKNFDAMYEKIRAVFGAESDELATNSALTASVPMASYSATGSMVNIVICDIGKDYKNGTNSGSIVGYFYAKDYFALSTPSSVYAYSNKGKYFYVDGYFAASSTSTVYSTLAHEFQHMIDFGIKTMKNGETSSTAHNEMKSMLCEDIMYSTLIELDKNFTKEDSPVARLPLFNRHYADIGLEYKDSSPEVYYSYANNYAFGAWLLRKYGGIPLLHEIATNNSVDENAILSALDATGADAESMEEILKSYSIDCTLAEDGEGFKAELSATELSYGGYEYSLDTIDLWNLASALPESYKECKDTPSYYKFDGPVLYGHNAQIALRPYGIALHIIGTATSESVTLNLNTGSISTKQKTYLIIE